LFKRVEIAEAALLSRLDAVRRQVVGTLEPNEIETALTKVFAGKERHPQLSRLILLQRPTPSSGATRRNHIWIRNSGVMHRFCEESRQMDASRVIFIHRANAVNIALDKRKQTI
jgi:hypothetical protein